MTGSALSAQPNPPRHIVAVSALVRNARNQILLVHSPRGDWEFPGGQVEETGVTASVGALVGVYSNIIRQPPIVMFGFLSEWLAGDPRTSPESLAVEWVPRDKALARIRRPAIHSRLKDMLDFDGRVIYRAYQVDPHSIQADYTVIEERFL